MAPYPYLSRSGELKYAWLGERTARALLLLVDATHAPDPLRGRAAELAGAITVRPATGLLAAHALASSAVDLVSVMLSLGMGIEDENNPRFIFELASGMGVLADALREAGIEGFDPVGLRDVLPAPAGSCGSSHAAAVAIFADARARFEPILTRLGFLDEAKLPQAPAEGTLPALDHPVSVLHGELAEQGRATVARSWAGWLTCERQLTAEVAAAARAGLIPAHDGGKLDLKRFELVIDRILIRQHEDMRQHLFSRWRTLATIASYIRMEGNFLPSLRPNKNAINGLAKLTSEVLGYTTDPKTDGQALLELLDVLRRLGKLALREDRLLKSGATIFFDAEFRAELMPVVTATLPRVLSAASMEVDALALRRGGDRVAASVAEDVTTTKQSMPSPPAESAPVDGGTWVPAKLLVDEADDRIDTPGKVTAFCDTHEIPRRPGLSKAGKPWKQRSDVHLPTWRAKRAALAKEDKRLQDAADRATVNKPLLDEWTRQDEAGDK